MNPDGSRVYLRDVARVELGGSDYSVQARVDGRPAAAVGIRLAPSANAVATANAVHAKVKELSKFFPPGVRVDFPYDSSEFVRVSIQEVVKTLMEAIVMVFLIIFLFLQNFRATFIPTIVIPVALLGTFAVMYALGFSINVLTMFGMVLAVGELVDDAIVVVENVERIMSEEGLAAARGDHQGDEANHRRAHRHFARVDGGVHSDGVLWRIGRRDLPAVFAGAGFVHVVLHLSGHVPDAGVVRLAAQAR